jgi:ethanolamine utilization microcompartment shell protein EutS
MVVTVRKTAVIAAGLSAMDADVLLEEVERFVTEVVVIEAASFPASS